MENPSKDKGKKKVESGRCQQTPEKQDVLHFTTNLIVKYKIIGVGLFKL